MSFKGKGNIEDKKDLEGERRKKMKRLKALIKMELRPALLIAAYFLLVDLFVLLTIRGQIQDTWRGFLKYGIENFMQYNDGLSVADFFTESILYALLFSIIGMMALVYVSFKNDKSIEIGRFLKSLPYTVKERCLTKMGVGIVTFTVTYVFYVIGMLALHMSYLNRFNEIYRVTILSEVYNQICDRGELIKVLILVYVACIAIYLFCMMFQYIVSNRLGAIIVAALVYLSPVFILNSLSAYVSVRYVNVIYEKIIYPLTEWLNKLIVVFTYLEWGEISINSSTATNITMSMSDNIITEYIYISLIGYRMAFYGAVALLSLVAILKLCVAERIEKSDYFIPSKWFRGIFTCGVTICGGLLLGDIYCIYLNGTNMGMIYGLLIFGGIMSFLIARKIASMGMRKGKEVHI